MPAIFYRSKDSDGNYIPYSSIEALLRDADNAGRVGYLAAYKHWESKYFLDVSEELAVVEEALGGQVGDISVWNERLSESQREHMLSVLVEHLDEKLTGGRLTDDQKQAIVRNLKQDKFKFNVNSKDHPRMRQLVLDNVIVPVIRAIVTSDAYMVE